MVALFAIVGAEAKAEEEGHEEAKELARVMKALEEGIDNIIRALEKPSGTESRSKTLWPLLRPKPRALGRGLPVKCDRVLL